MKQLLNSLKNPKLVYAYVTIAFAFLTYYIFKHWTYVPQILSSPNLSFLLYAFIFGCINFVAYSYVSHVLYKELGAEISYWRTLEIILASRIGIYLPGRIWYASNFYIFSRKLNISPSIIAQSFGLNNIFLFMTGGVCSLPIVLPFLSFWEKIVFISIICLLLIFSHPQSIKYIVSFIPKLNKIVKDQIYFTRFTSKLYLTFLIYFFALWIISGVRLYFCILTLTPVQFNDFMTILSACAASLLIGMLAIFAPGGIGVREGVGVFILSTILPVEIALFVMIISRLLSAIIDLGGGISAFYLLNKNNNEEQKFKESNVYECEKITTW